MALLRFDTQAYGTGLLAFDEQASQARATTQNVFVDLFLLARATQTYTPASNAPTQTVTSALNLTASAAQSYTPAIINNTVHTATSALALSANGTQALTDQTVTRAVIHAVIDYLEVVL